MFIVAKYWYEGQVAFVNAALVVRVCLYFLGCKFFTVKVNAASL